ncbi:AfsR/SARP family transcriptional regulator [Asanoa siamensis]|uniref:DNA-binding SARP family transcriptional activator n=1 Tax=Asanoa siamensis TaxID=926357 RepID=A0ABQ4D1L1_9ACTN|nr:BTAD domain-containing putative transcriptional regulator [Asanoa siamensis]GIF77431.1 hypothetical protein Asi02nite_69490 [Asanoa siamensis]
MAGVTARLTVDVLGPLAVSVDGRPLTLRPAKLRSLLAVLAMSAGDDVTISRLADSVWGEAPPVDARRTTQIHVMRLRRVIGFENIRTVPAGYRLQIAPDDVDALRFRQVLNMAAAATDPAVEREWLGQALALWRGDPFDGVTSPWLEMVESPRLTELYVAAQERRIELDLELEPAGDLIAELRELTARYPLRERLWGHLMTALFRSGRQADALAAYQRLYRTLAEELGAEPTPAVRDLHRRMLSGDPTLTALRGRATRTQLPQSHHNGSFGRMLRENRERLAMSRDALAERVGLSHLTVYAMESGHALPPPTSVGLLCDAMWLTGDRRSRLENAAKAERDARPDDIFRVAPSDLPRDLPDFIGRTGEVMRLFDVLTAPRPATTVCAIDGMAGIGKSSLAVHVAHHVAHTYPDAVLFADLHGHTADREPRTAAETLSHLLRALGVVPEQLPESLDERVARWRTLTMSRRILLVVDDATSAEQIRPLIPSGAGCAVMVTSRHRLTDLDATAVVSVDPMPATDAASLLRRASGRPLGDLDVRQVLDLCAGLPLALSIAGTRLRHRGAWSAAELAARLRDEHRRLTELRLGARGVAAAFSLSHRLLSDSQRRVFRAAGMHPGRRFDARSVAAACALSVAAVEDALEGLLDAHLVVELKTGRYQLHDLLRLFARQQAARHPTETEETVRRLLAYYAVAADRADRCAYRHRQRVDVPADAPMAPDFGSTAAALAWFDTEIDTLVTATHMAFERGMDVFAWSIPVAAWGCFSLRSRWAEWIDSHHVAVAAAERCGDKIALGQALSGLGVALAETAAYDSAITCYQRAVTVRREIGDLRGEASSLGNLAVVYAELSRYEDAIACAEKASLLSRSTGDAAREAATITNLGEMKRRTGDLVGALSDLLDALKLCQRIESEHSESIVLGYLAAVHNDLKEYDRAADYGLRALDLLQRTTDDQLRTSDVLVALGHSAHGLNDTEAARQRWQQAHRTLSELGHPRSVEVWQLLQSLPPP